MPFGGSRNRALIHSLARERKKTRNSSTSFDLTLSLPLSKKQDDVPREFWVSFHGLPRVDRLRDLRTARIGRLSSFVGTVTRTSEVRPELFLGAFRCLECGAAVRGVEQHFKYTEPLVCPAPACGNRRSWSLVKEESTFVDWQRLRVQESADEVPAGSLPRTIEVVLRGDVVERARAGDSVVFVGDLVAVPDVAAISAPGERIEARSAGPQGAGGGGQDGGVTGPRFLGVRELTYRLAFLACSVEDAAARDGGAAASGADNATNADGSAVLTTPDDVLASLTDAEAADLEAMRANPRAYADLARSIAPGVRGHDDVKRSVLLQLLGGVHKTTADGASLRGDINVAIVGDPSTAKSQILKYVASFLPRAVYTSGRASSAAGLTASVVRESDSGEMAIEAGALMLANGAVCCIDEFDKMDPKDQVAIHEVRVFYFDVFFRFRFFTFRASVEVGEKLERKKLTFFNPPSFLSLFFFSFSEQAMEQQTISVTKAGVQATLVARTSILAAANPAGGRYDRSKPLRYNVALPPAILSRFDLLHVMVDEPDEAADAAVAAHIVSLHQRPATALAGLAPYSTPQLQRYVRLARAYRPVLLPAAQRAIVDGYRRLRSEDAAPGSSAAYRITVRQLEALVRLSEACARARLSARVGQADVREALRLLRHSVIEVEPPPEELGGGFGDDDEDGVDDDEAAAAAVAAAAAGRREAAGGADGMEVDEDADVGAAPADDADGGNPDAAARTARQPIKVPRSKVERVKDLLLMRLRSLEEGAELVAGRNAANDEAAATAAADEEANNGGAPDASNPARAAEVGGAPVAAVRQCDLVAWYFDFQARRGALLDVDLASERALVHRIVSHLIRARGVLVVVEVPGQQAGEVTVDYRRRCVRERLLAMNPNFSDE